MASVSYSPEKLPPAKDQKLEEIAGQAALMGKAIRIRIQPGLYSDDKQGYVSWSGLVWVLDVENVDEGRRLREGLEKFLTAFGDAEKQDKVLQLLETL